LVAVGDVGVDVGVFEADPLGVTEGEGVGVGLGVGDGAGAGPFASAAAIAADRAAHVGDLIVLPFT